MSKTMLSTPKSLVEQLLAAKSSADVKALLGAARAAGLDGDRYLGDRISNAATVQLASNPYSPIIERITNANDSRLELEAERHRGEEMSRSPREAATRWFNVPKTGINDLEESERRALAAGVEVTLEESGVRQAPTITICDSGIGQHPEDFPATILSLNQTNKLKKPWLQGAYGQGGSATFRFCKYTLIVGRRAPELRSEGQADRVGWTVVWEDPGDPAEYALAMYKYLVGPDNQVPSFDPELLPDPAWHGMRVTHVTYELPRYSQAFTQLDSGMWWMLHSYLFDPVLPFLIGGSREIDIASTKRAGETRVVIGNAARLNNPKGPSGRLEVTHRNSQTFDLSRAMGADIGRFRLRYWVLQRDESSTSKREPSSAYVGAEDAVSMTLFGQRQDSKRRGWLKQKLNLPYLQHNMIVQIDVDELLPGAKRQLFASTRERGVEGPLREAIYEEASRLLKDDGELRRLDTEERERLRARGSSQVGKKVKDRISQFVKDFHQAQQKKNGGEAPGDNPSPQMRPPRPPSPPRPSDDSHLPNFPTRIRFERDPITIGRGRRTTVWVDIDTKNDYLRQNEDSLSLSFTDLDGKVKDVSRSELLAGRAVWTLQAEPDVPLGDGELHATLVTPNGLITASAAVRVFEPPPKTQGKGTRGRQKGVEPNIEWVSKDEWDDHKFNERTVGSVDITDDSIDIWVNQDQKQLLAVLESRRLSGPELKTRKSRYLFPVACGLYKYEYFVKTSGTEAEEEYVLAEQERLAEAVLFAIDEKLIEIED
jgi:hypothetical protein